MIKEIRITTEDFFIGNFGCPEATDEIIGACTKNLIVDEKGISKRDEEHKKVKKRGRSIWYEKYFLRIAKVEKDYGKI